MVWSLSVTACASAQYVGFGDASAGAAAAFADDGIAAVARVVDGMAAVAVRAPASHGYEVRRQLEVHGVTTDPSAMYRVLRKLDSAGCVTSSWAKSASGPRRRQYQLTALGRRELSVLVATLTATHDVHAAFLHAHQQALQDPR